ncbi:class I SAM-dependent methyltransferase [Sphingomonas sp. PL-96]|uniref:class I SAM-dependent methyltransferase n=1 Tax=Sphingomonas sp. PL-96 TaxID=2887201 RepID=UPI001E44A4AF|nr:class I SAM-dependent methyltransferase [Sphingomonas sp. PL-96]MCC2976898.1 class I SAM-dependent methyltransferase [Sphingomonas sp. PL-96]
MASLAAQVAVPCPLCNRREAWGWGCENGYSAVKCVGCGLVYVSPRPADDMISEATRTGQHRHEAGALSVVYAPSRRKLARYEARMRRVLAGELGQDPVSWLDIGAGFGELIEALRDVLPAGSRIRGIEPMAAKAAHARARGLPVTSDKLAQLSESFDFVSLINVFSHLPDPGAFLADVRRLVRPGGTLVLMTGNGAELDSAQSYPDRLDLPDHLVFAGRPQLDAFLSEAGFEPYRRDLVRLDTASWAAKAAVKKLLGQPVPLVIPYRSRFRDMLYLARRVR